MHRILRIQTDVAVNACALVPPALRFQSLDINGEDIRSAVKIRTVGNIKERFRIRTEGSFHQRAVEIKFRIDSSSFKADEKLSVCKRFIQKKGFSVPSVTTGAISVRKQIIFVKVTLRIIVVRKIYGTPIGVIPYLSRRTYNGAGFTTAVGIRMAVRRLHVDIPSVETPLIIKIHYDSFHKRLTPL